MPISEIGTIGGLVEYLIEHGIQVGVAAELVAKAFGWGVDAAKFRLPENLVAPKIRVESHPQLFFASSTPGEEAAPQRKPAAPRQIACPWPEDFRLGDVQIEFADKRGFKQPEIQRMWERFRDRNIAKGEKYVGQRGWEAAWRTWVNNQVEFKARDSRARAPDLIDGRL